MRVTKLGELKIASLAVAMSLSLTTSSRGQTAATLADLGITAPTPGASDIFQVSTNGQVNKPDGLNYYTDNGVNNPSIGEPGQTFATGASSSGYTLTSVALRTGGGSQSLVGSAHDYLLHLYSVSGGTATLLATFTATGFSYTDGDWLKWSGFSVSLSPNANYAYSFGLAAAGNGWDAIWDARTNLYPGGEIGLFPTGGGAITFSSTHAFDAVFVLGVATVNTPTASAPTISPTNNPVYAGTTVTLAEAASGTSPLTYQWRGDGGSGGVRTNLPGATATNLVLNTAGLAAGAYRFDVIVSNSFGSVTSAVAVVNLAAASAPFVVADISPASATTYTGGSATFSVAFNGTLPIFYQWRFNAGGGATNLQGATNASLTLNNLQAANAGSYWLTASNAVGGPVSSSVATLTVAALPPYPSAVMANSPVAYWRLNETAGTTGGGVAAADATHQFNGVYGASATDNVPGPRPSAGFSGFESSNTALQVTNGVANSFVTVPALNLTAATATIAVWVYPIGTPPANCGIFFCRNGGDASGFDFSTGGQLGYTWNNNSQATWSWGSALAPPAGQWSFIALVVSPGSAVAYLCNTNGQLSATNAIAHTAETFAVSSCIGNDTFSANGARTFNGLLDEMAVFNTALSSTQILNLYYSGVGGAPIVRVPVASPSTTVFAGTTVTLAASVAGPSPFQFQWETNGVPWPGATNSTLVLSNTSVAASGNYDVVVGNNSGSNRSPVLVLTVRPPGGPIFTQQPTPPSATNYVGGLVTFAAAVDGTQPISLQWQHDGVNILGATASSLTLAGLQTNSAGAYSLVASNSLGTTNSAPAFLTILPTPNPGALNVLTYHNDNTRQGANTNEVLLTLANVNKTTFGKLFTYAVDGHIYAEPLYVSALPIPGQGVHNTVIVATEHDSVYAFDADSNAGTNGGLLWHTNLGISAVMPNNDFGNRYGPYHDLVPEMGITSTPVIDPNSGTLYLDVFTHEGSSYFHRIHALNITNGNEQPYGPVVVSASVPGRGVGSTNGIIQFVAQQHLQRPALTLAGGMLYVAYSSYADTDPYHGWVIGFNATNLLHTTNFTFNTTPGATTSDFGGNAGEGGIWMGGNGLSVDASNNLYFEIGNGSFSVNTNGPDYGDSFVKLGTANGFTVADYFTPYNQASLSAADTDLGSGGPLLLPDAMGSATHPHLIVGCGKEGKIYLLDRDNLGHYNSGNDSQIIQEVPGAVGGTWSSPAYWNHLIYYQGNGDVMKAFGVTNAVLSTSPVTRSSTSFGFPGATPAISANGVGNGIAWIIQADAYSSGGPSVLHAYNATNLSQELYNTSQNLARDNPGGAVKMSVPTVMNGKVYVGAEFALSVYGNSLFLATPTISPNGLVFTNAATVTLADATPNAAIYYTLDGTAPSTNSILYTGPFVLNSSAMVQAVATEQGAVNSGVVTAGFVNSAATGVGTGLQGSYWSNLTSVEFTNSSFAIPATLVRTDAVVNFNWTSTAPDPSIGLTNFTARWLGAIQPQYNESYTFVVTADSGVRLFLNGQLLIDKWIDEPVTEWSNSITLKAQQLYNLQLDFYNRAGGAQAQLSWRSPSTPLAIIPTSQLYPATNPPPAVVLLAPTNGATFTADASVTFTADADAPANPIDHVAIYANGNWVGSVSNLPYTLTVTGLAATNYLLTAAAVDASGLGSTSAPVNVSVVVGSGLPYGYTSRAPTPAFFNMPTTFNGALPSVLSATRVFSDTPNLVPTNGFIPYAPNTPLWSDGAVKTRYLAVPYQGGALTPDQQISFAATGEWGFPAGTVFIKTFQLLTNQNDPASLRRLETRLLVRDVNGGVYGVTYKWRPDNSEADLLTTSLTEAITMTNSSGTFTQNWYYPSPADCLTCHNPAANYVLGVKTRQLNGNYAYAAATDNQLRTMNRLGLFSPAIDESSIPGFAQSASLTNLSASLEQRARSYLDANCAQCHRPTGTGPSFDGRYDTPLSGQRLINAPVIGNLGYDNVAVVKPKDVWRSILYDRMNTTNAAIRMPPLARNLIDTNAVQVMTDWINSLSGGTQALAPPTLTPASGIFTNTVTLTLRPPDPNATVYYTLDGTLPTTNSIVYTNPFALTYSAIVQANAFETGYVNSVQVTGPFTIVPPLYSFFTPGFGGGGSFQSQFWGPVGPTYVLQGSTNLTDWVPVSTNVPSAAPFYLFDPGATNFPSRYYRLITQ